MIVARRQRAEPAKKIEDLTAVPVDVIHTLRTVDDDLVEAKQLHKVQLARIEMLDEQVRHRSRVQRLRFFDGDHVRLCRRSIALRFRLTLFNQCHLLLFLYEAVALWSGDVGIPMPGAWFFNPARYSP